MDTLKRPYNGDGETGVAVKKRAISSTPGSPPRQFHVNGNAKTPEYDDPRDEDDLEVWEYLLNLQWPMEERR